MTEFPEGVLDGLREILLSSGEGTFYGPGGEVIGTGQVPFLAGWHLDRIGFDPDLGRSRIVCVLSREGTTVTGVIDAGDWIDGGSYAYAPMTGATWGEVTPMLSVAVQEKILTRDPAEFGGDTEVRIR